MNDRKAKRPPPPADFDDNPEWTEEMHARARPASEVHGKELADQMVRKQGRPRLDPSERKQPVSIRLSPAVLEALRASGDGWQTRVDELLATILASDPEKKVRSLHRLLKSADALSIGPMIFERVIFWPPNWEEHLVGVDGRRSTDELRRA